MVKTQQQAWAALVEANPVPDVDVFSRENVEDATHLATHNQGSSGMTQLETKAEQRKPKKSGVLWLVAAAVALLVGVGLIVVNQNEQTPVADRPAPTNPPVAPTQVDAFSIDDAESMIDAWFDAYNTGDDQASLASLAPGVVISNSINGTLTLDEWQMLLAWNSAQQTVWAPQDCAANEREPGVSVTVICSTVNIDAPSQAVDAPGVETTLVAIVTAQGITELRFDYDEDVNFNHVGIPMAVWLVANHPDVAEAGTVGFGNWTTIEEAAENGRLTRLYATEWANYLVENNCTYQDGC